MKIHYSNATQEIIGVICVIMSMVLGLTGASLFAKPLFALVSAPGTTAIRLIFSTIILIIIWRPWRNLPSRKEWLTIFLYGISIVGMNLFFYMSIERIPFGISLALEFSGPLSLALFASRSAKDFLWILFAVVGITLLLPVTKISADIDIMGVIFAFIAGFFWASYIVLCKKIGSGTIHNGIAVALGVLIAALLALPMGVIYVGSAFFSWRIILLGSSLALFSSALPYTLEMIAMKKLPVKTIGIIMSLDPVVGALSGFIFLGEILSFPQLLAIVLVICASIGSTWSNRQSLAPEITP